MVPETRQDMVVETKTRQQYSADEIYRHQGKVIQKGGKSIYIPATNEGPPRSERVLRGIKGFSKNPNMAEHGNASGLMPPDLQEIASEESNYRKGLPREQIKVILED